MSHLFKEMAPIRLVETKDMPKDEWLGWRRKGITGTDVAAIFEMNPYKTSWQCYQDKLGLLPPPEDNNRMRFGRDFEDVVAKWFAEETGFKVQRENAIFQHAEYEWMLANIDRRVLLEKSVLECKTALYMFQKDKWGPNGSDVVPTEYLFQIYHYMIVFGVRIGYLAVIFTDTKEFRHYRFELDEQLAEHIILGTKDFWYNKVIARVEPPIVSFDDVSSKYPKENKESIEADPEVLGLCKEHEAIRQRIKAMEKRQEEIKVQVGLFVGEHKDLLTDDTGATLAAFSTARPREYINKEKLMQLNHDVYLESRYFNDPKRSLGFRWQTLKKMVEIEDEG